MSTAKAAYRDAMRDDLLVAAQRVIERKGFGGLTVRDILAEADVAPGTFYAYFSGKDELLAELAHRALVEVLRAAAADPDTTTGESLAALVRNAMLAPNPDAGLLSEMRGRPGDSAHKELVRNFNTELVAGTRPLIEQARDRGHVEVADVDALVELLDIVWDGLTRRAVTGTFVTGYERVGAVFLGLVQAGIKLPVLSTAAPPGRAAKPRSDRRSAR
jgi:AcrR family transcriptional regulator